MKGNAKLIDTLNSLLADELTAINQYIVHAEMAENWGYGKLHEHFEKRAIDEMKHAEKLIGRIIFLEGLPVVSNLRKINIGAAIESSHTKQVVEAPGRLEAWSQIDEATLQTLLGDQAKFFRIEDHHQGQQRA